jgi:lysophospholipase L1-like esterase
MPLAIMPDRAKRLSLRRVLGALWVLLVSSVVALLGVLAIDVYMHKRTQDLAGVNVWGYRGTPAGAKQSGEVRVVMLGGSTAFGYGLPSHESISAFLERRLNADPRAGGRRFTVINLGAPGQGAHGFRFDLADYAYLDYDVALLYEGYNDLGSDGVPADVPQRASPNYLLWRRSSPVFRLTGYYPIFPLVFREKAMALRAGNLNTAYEKKDVEFKPNIASRATANALQTAATIGDALEHQLGALTNAPVTASSDPSCRDRWRQYCGAVREAVEAALARGTRVAVITQPYVSDKHVEQQADLAAMLASRFGDNSHLRYVNLGHVVDLKDREIAYDRIHLVASGNDRVAAELVAPVLDLLR